MTEQEQAAHLNGAPVINTAPEPVSVAPETVALPDDVIALLAQYSAQAAAAEGAKQGALGLFMRQKGLEGQWGIANNGRELVRRP